MKHLYIILCVLWFSLGTSSVHADVLQLSYQGFTIWLDCEKRSAIKFHYTLGKDIGNLERVYAFHLDPEVDKACQQTSTSSYKYEKLDKTCEKDENDRCFHKGHLVAYNQMDHSLISSHQTNYMTNILPQARNLNTGVWKRTEDISECYRDFVTLDIFGGPIWGKNEMYLSNHSITVPKSFWKVMIGDGKVIAWIFPNSNEESLNADDLPKYSVTIETIERETGQIIPVDSKYKKELGVDSLWDLSDCKKDFLR